MFSTGVGLWSQEGSDAGHLALVTRPLRPRLSNLEVLSRGASCLVVAIGMLGLVGWGFEVEALRRVGPGLPVMAPATAVALILAGFSLWLLDSAEGAKRKRLAARACAGAVTLIGALTLCQYVLGWNEEIDALVFGNILGDVSFAGRPAFLSALNFFLFGIALVLMGAKCARDHRSIELLTVTAILVSLLALIGYACHVPMFYQWRSLPPNGGMALHTMMAFIGLGVGMLCARPADGLMHLILSPTAGGVMARRLLLAPVIIPLVTGLLKLAGERSGIYDRELASWLFAFLNIFIFTVALWWSAEWLHRAETARTHLEEELQRFFTLSLDMVCIAGLDGYFKRLNPAFQQTLGYTSGELLRHPFIEFVHPDDRSATLAEVEKLSRGEPTLQFENRYRCKDGSWRWLSWRARPVPSEGLLYATAHDITGRKESEAAIQQLNAELRERAGQLEAANKELETFSYSISHDLRAPLRHVHGYAEMLTSATSGQLSDEAKRCLQTITDASVEMGQLIDDLLGFSRISRMGFRAIRVPLDRLVQDAIKGLEMTTRGRNIIWKVASLPPVMGDPSMLKQVLTNLLSNAVKYSRERDPAEIEIGYAGEEDGRVICYVRDNGAGFDMQYADRLFGVFQRLHRSDEFEGTGIGLATVRRIVTRHGGRTWAEGVPNQGAAFYFTLTPAPETSAPKKE